MFSSVRRYRLLSGSIDDLLHLVDSDFAESVQEMDGFVEYQVLECGNGELVTITTFRDRQSAAVSAEMATGSAALARAPGEDIARRAADDVIADY